MKKRKVSAYHAERSRLYKIRRRKFMAMQARGMTLRQIGDAEVPTIKRQRVYQIIHNIK